MNNLATYDKVIIGAGIYGLYAANFCADKGEKVIVLEFDEESVSRATYVNQARVHNGYHYPRSYSTAIKSSKYFHRFNEDFPFSVKSDFRKIYATSAKYSWTSAEQFKKFSKAANIKCDEINSREYFKEGLVDGAFDTQEYTYDAMEIKKHYLEVLGKKSDKVTFQYGARIEKIDLDESNNTYKVYLKDGSILETGYVLNATYASTNQIAEMMGFDKFKIKYELCEIILCKTSDKLKDVGITVMDGPFFSVMPFGHTGFHSLTSVTFTPHKTSYDLLPTFDCQKDNVACSPLQLDNCNLCPNKPTSAWDYMYKLSRKYLGEDIDLYYEESLFSMKPILMASEIDDSRPTVIKQFSTNPTFVSVLSGKINTVYDLDEVL